MADFSNQTKLFSLNGIDNLRDPVRNTRWRVLIPSEIFAATGIQVTNGAQFNNGQDGTDEFALHIKTAVIPTLKNENKFHWYMGFKQAHVVNTDMSTEQEFETILLEDMRAYEAMIAWEQACHNTGILSDGSNTDRMNQTGLRLGLGNHKDIKNETSTVVRNNTVKVELYNWMRGDVIMRLNLINAYPTEVAGFNLNYNSADIVNFKFKLWADRWTVQIPEGYTTGL
jgi:hypothetical protein